MLLPSLRLILALTTLALGILLIVHASKSRYRQKDPALVLIIIATLAELALLCLEIAYLGFSLAKVPSPNFFPYISEWAFMVLALAYLYVTYQHWLVNGLKLTGYIPFQFFVGASLINLGIFALQFLFPDLSKEIHIINQIILSAIILYAGICAVIARSKKVDFYPATRGAFWMALFCIIYGP